MHVVKLQIEKGKQEKVKNVNRYAHPYHKLTFELQILSLEPSVSGNLRSSRWLSFFLYHVDNFNDFELMFCCNLVGS